MYSHSALVAYALFAVSLFQGWRMGFGLSDDIWPPGLRLDQNSNPDCF